MYLENIAIVFMSYDAFPIRDYVVHLVESGKITAKKVAENTKLLDEKLEQLKAAGLTVEDITQDMLAAYEKSMEVINIMVFAMVIFSTVMIVVVLYNSGSLSFNERMKELATLKVMGLQSAQIRRLLTVQNIWLSIIGIIIGTPLGNMSLNAMMNSNGENFDYSLSVPVIDYIIAAIIVLIISMLVSFMFTKRIKKLDLVETLKGVE